MKKLVLVRAYGDEALKRVLISLEKRTAYIASESSLLKQGGEEFPGLGFPRNDVFHFNSILYEKLKFEFDSERKTHLWNQAVPI